MCLNTVGNTLIPVVLFEGKDPARAKQFRERVFRLGYVITPLLFSLLGSAAVSYKTGVFILGALMVIFPCWWRSVPASACRDGLRVLDGVQAARDPGRDHRRAGVVLLHLARSQHGDVEQART